MRSLAVMSLDFVLSVYIKNFDQQFTVNLKDKVLGQQLKSYFSIFDVNHRKT